MMDSVDAYLGALRRELAGVDPAITQDALADAEDHLRTALDGARQAGEGESDVEALVEIIEKYGAPEEIALAYQDASLTEPALAGRGTPASRSWLGRFFGILSDPRAWGALLYMLLSLVTGLVYFSWAVTGLSLALGLMILIIGLPVTVLVLLSIRSLALIEGRIVEALLAVRMPRRPLLAPRGADRWQQVKSLFSEGRTWTAVIYMILQLPLGVTYFTLFVTLLSFSLSLMASPLLQILRNEPLFQFGASGYYLQGWQMPLVVGVGFVLLLGSMHLAGLLGRLHGRLAKALLVGTG